MAAIETATRAALAGEVDGIVTSPINKEAIWAAGSEHLGHTEMLGELTGAAHFDTMFVVRGLKIFFTTRHLALRKALDQITEERVARASGTPPPHCASSAMTSRGSPSPRSIRTVARAATSATRRSPSCVPRSRKRPPRGSAS